MAESKDTKQECPVARTLSIVGKKWTILILRDLCCSETSIRFNELKRNLSGVTPTILSKRLKELEKDGIIERRIVASEIPVKVEYSLTEKGVALQEIIRDLKDWGVKWGFKGEHDMLLCDQCKQQRKNAAQA